MARLLWIDDFWHSIFIRVRIQVTSPLITRGLRIAFPVTGKECRSKAFFRFRASTDFNEEKEMGDKSRVACTGQSNTLECQGNALPSPSGRYSDTWAS